MSQSCCLVYFLICSIQFTIADIFFNSSCKQVSILEYDSQRTSQVVLLNLGNVDSIVTDLTFLNIVETVDQICDGCLSCTCGAYESKFLSFAFCDIAAGILSCINKFYITFILFRLLVNEPEDTFCTCKCHNDGVELLCHLHEWLGKALGEL